MPERRLTNWLHAVWRRHREAFLKALSFMTSAPLSNVMTLLAIAIALSLPAGLYLGVASFTHVFSQWDSRQINAFMHMNIDGKRLHAIAEGLRQNPDIESIEEITRAQSLEDFRNNSGLENALDMMIENPLPAVLVIHPSAKLETAAQIKALAKTLETQGAIDFVQSDEDWLQKILAIGRGLQRFSLFLGIVFGLTVALVIHIGMRAEILKRREEIEVIKLVGGSQDYIQRPFIYNAIIYGIVGALLALIIIKTVFLTLQPSLNEIAQLYEQHFELTIPLDFAASLILTAVLLSLLAALVTLRLRLREIEPQSTR
ncbi:MAG TPA: ABC transporter permease [Gammaproteobacteria bacterium]|nr:ABC transporter permease [Gammaproteobacteria bacterium]